MENLVIIGSDSFIATQFYNSIASKDEVKLFSRQFSGKPNEQIKNLFQINEGDLKGSSVIINFAAIVHQPKLNDEKLYKKINTDLPIHLAMEAKKAGVKHFIQMSTIAIYGSVTSISENSIEQPNNLYGASKLAADKALLAMQDENFNVSIIRPPMVYGGGKAPGNLLKLVKFAQKGIPLPFKNVNNARDFIHVLNLVDAMNVVITNKIYGIVIPTDENSVSTETIINHIKKYSSKKIRQFAIPTIIQILIKGVVPSIYNKVFGDLRIECNLPSEIYMPKFTIEKGIKEMTQTNDGMHLS
jgi:UDP-glucose 4-epimerase